MGGKCVSHTAFGDVQLPLWGTSRRFFSPWFVEEPRSGRTTARGTGG